MAQSESKPGLMTRLLRALGIGKRQRGEPERYAGQPTQSRSSGESRSGGDHRSGSSRETEPAPASVDGKPAVDPNEVTAAPEDSVRSDTGINGPSIGDAAKREIAERAADQIPAQDIPEAWNPPGAEGLASQPPIVGFEREQVVGSFQWFGPTPEWLASTPIEVGERAHEHPLYPQPANHSEESGERIDSHGAVLPQPAVVSQGSGEHRAGLGEEGQALGVVDSGLGGDRPEPRAVGSGSDQKGLAPVVGSRKDALGLDEIRPGPGVAGSEPGTDGPVPGELDQGSSPVGAGVDEDRQEDGPVEAELGGDVSVPAAEPGSGDDGPGPRKDGPAQAGRDQESSTVEVESTPPGGQMVRPGVDEKEPAPRNTEDAPPRLEPGLQEIVRRLAPPQHSRGRAATEQERQSNGAQDVRGGTALSHERGAPGEKALLEREGNRPPEAAKPLNETSANRAQKENISPARSASKRGRGRMSPESSPGGQHQPNVSRETLGFGEVAGKVGEDEVMEDEAAIAVREAASRAAAEVPGAKDPGHHDASPDSRGDVSRETSQPQAEAPGGPSSGTPTVDERPSPTEEPVATVDMERAARDARVTFKINRGAYNRFVIAVANQKGGVGKSTTAVNLGAYLALAGARVLVVDLDPQGNASTGLGLDHRQIEPSIYDVLMGDSDAAAAIRQTPVRNLDVLPSTIDLAGAEVELVNAFSRETRLRQALGAVRYGYDLVFIDCPPSLGLLTVNALAAADELLIPIQCEYYALEGLGQLLRNVDLVRVNLNQALHIGGIVLTMYDGRTRLAEQVVQEVRKHFTDLVYQTVVPRSVRLSEAPGYGVPIALYDPLSRGGIAYRDLALELADRTGLLAPTREGAN
jgi:chromosome partitioning protein